MLPPGAVPSGPSRGIPWRLCVAERFHPLHRSIASISEQECNPVPENRNHDNGENPGRKPESTGKMGLFDVRTSFFRPLWRRIVATALCLGWALYELSLGAVFWAILFGAAGAHLAWQFFVTFDDRPGSGEEKN